VLHPKGNVKTLHDALEKRFDEFYEKQEKVYFERCEKGYIKEREGPDGVRPWKVGAMVWEVDVSVGRTNAKVEEEAARLDGVRTEL
jgi:hypothetical protein